MTKFRYVINGNEYEVSVDSFEGNVASLTVNGVSYEVEVKREKKVTRIERPKVATGTGPQPARTRPEAKPGDVKAPLPGVVKQVLVKEGEGVKNGQCLMILEAMKMDNEIYAPQDGTVLKLHVAAGQSVLEGELLATVGGA